MSSGPGLPGIAPHQRVAPVGAFVHFAAPAYLGGAWINRRKEAWEHV